MLVGILWVMAPESRAATDDCIVPLMCFQQDVLRSNALIFELYSGSVEATSRLADTLEFAERSCQAVSEDHQSVIASQK